MFDIDEAMALVVARATEPALAAIKLAWWHERLQELDQGKVAAEPRLQAAAVELLPRGISGTALAELESGWATLLQECPDARAALAGGARLFGMAASLLGGDPSPTVEIAGELHAAGIMTRLGRAPNELSVVRGSPAVPGRLRPLTGLAALAARDLKRGGPPFEPEGTPGRAWTLLRHRLTGRFPG